MQFVAIMYKLDANIYDMPILLKGFPVGKN